jgi:hypothetical protein
MGRTTNKIGDEGEETDAEINFNSTGIIELIY